MLSSGCDFLSRHDVYMRAILSPTDWKWVWVSMYICVCVSVCVCVCACVCKREYKRGSRDKKWCSSFSCLSPRGQKRNSVSEPGTVWSDPAAKLRGENVSMCLSWAMKGGECLFLLGTCFMEKHELVKAFSKGY